MTEPNQSYYWTPEWQAAEHEADEDIRLGRVRQFASAADALAWLKSDDEPGGDAPPR